MRKAYRNTLFFILISLLILWGADYIYGYFLRHDQFSKVCWLYSKKNYPARFGILGASRVYTMMNTEEVSAAKKVKGINISIDGASIMEQYVMLRRYVENNPDLKELYFNTDFYDLDKNINTDFRLWYFLPYIEKDSVLAEETKRVYGLEHYLLWRYVPFYKYANYNSRYLIQLTRNLAKNYAHQEFNQAGDALFEKAGSMPEYPPGKLLTISVTPLQQLYLEKILSLCQQHHIRVHLYTAPVYRSRYVCYTNRYELLDSFFRPLLKKYQADMYIFCELPMCSNASLFSNPVHLNKTGTDSFVKNFVAAFATRNTTNDYSIHWAH
jgi:hypothetical protein